MNNGLCRFVDVLEFALGSIPGSASSQGSKNARLQQAPVGKGPVEEPAAQGSSEVGVLVLDLRRSSCDFRMQRYGACGNPSVVREASVPRVFAAARESRDSRQTATLGDLPMCDRPRLENEVRTDSSDQHGRVRNISVNSCNPQAVSKDAEWRIGSYIDWGVAVGDGFLAIRPEGPSLNLRIFKQFVERAVKVRDASFRGRVMLAERAQQAVGNPLSGVGRAAQVEVVRSGFPSVNLLKNRRYVEEGRVVGAAPAICGVPVDAIKASWSPYGEVKSVCGVTHGSFVSDSKGPVLE